MKTVKNLCAIILLQPLLAGNCNKDFFNGYDLRFKIKNNSANSIYFDNNYLYPDTFPDDNPIASKSEYKILSGNIGGPYASGTNWEKIIDNSPRDTISLFVFNADSLEKLPFDTIIAKYIILQRYDLTLQNMKDRNWEIEFPYDSTKGKLKVWKK